MSASRLGVYPRWIATLLLASSLAAAPSAKALGLLGWFLIDQAFSRLSTPFIPAQIDGRITLLMLQQTQAAATVLNQELPLDLGDDLAATQARALGPGALEIDLVALVAAPSALSAAAVDARWGGPLKEQICKGAFFTAWMSRGGSLQFSVKSKDGAMAQQYVARAGDCPR